MLPFSRPASFRVTDSLGSSDLCADCKGALDRKGILRHPQGGTPLDNALITATEPAPDKATCDWCELRGAPYQRRSDTAAETRLAALEDLLTRAARHLRDDGEDCCKPLLREIESALASTGAQCIQHVSSLPVHTRDYECGTCGELNGHTDRCPARQTSGPVVTRRC